MKVIISTGQGRLHLIQSAVAIKKAGVSVKVITGWIPSNMFPDRLVNLFGRIVGSKNLLYGLRKRKPKELVENCLHSHSLSEFTHQILQFLSRFGFLKKYRAVKLGWLCYGISSKRDIKKADVFHVRSGAGNSGAILKAKKQGMLVVVDHSAAHPQEIYKQLSKIYGTLDIPIDPSSGLWKLVLQDCNEADVLLVNSNYVKRTFVERGYSSDNIYVIPLGIRQDFLDLKISYETTGPFKILFTGAIRKWKGVHLIIEALETMLMKNSMIELHLIGSLSPEIHVPNHLIENNNLFLHGHLPQDELKEHLINADVYVFPSYCEGAAQSLKEAMAIGLPVIATEQSGAPLVNRQNGLIIEDNSAIAISDAILDLINDAVLREELGRNASKTISNGHTWEEYGSSVVKLYGKLLS